MTRHNIGLQRAGLHDASGALKEYEEARRLYEPIVAADPSNAWVEGSLADLYLAIGKALEELHRDPGDAPCALFLRSNGIFERLRAGGRLNSLRAEGSVEAAAAAGRCRGSAAQFASPER